MMEVRWHGRGGQGIVTASDLLARATVHEGRYALHMPEFGPETRLEAASAREAGGVGSLVH